MSKTSGLVEVTPFDQFDHFRRMLDDSYWFGKVLSSREADVWKPPTDVFETKDKIIIKMSLPGVNPKDIGIEFNGDVVTICGFRRWDHSQRVVAYHQMEIRNGYFKRAIRLNIPFDPDGAAADYKEGFLKLEVPKAREPVQRVLVMRLNL